MGGGFPQEIANYHAIDGESDFFHVGGKSMLLVELQTIIYDTFEISMPLVRLFESSTLSSMALIIENGANTIYMESIDWEHETDPFDLLQIPESSGAVMAVLPIGQWAIAARPLGLRVLTAFFENIELGGPITFPRLRKTERAE